MKDRNGDVIVVYHALNHDVDLIVLSSLEVDWNYREQLVALDIQLLLRYTDEIRIAKSSKVRLGFWLFFLELLLGCLTLLNWDLLFLDLDVIW
jgi:hypothetical protein